MSYTYMGEGMNGVTSEGGGRDMNVGRKGGR